jgi:ubiquinone/menaquinone biosynthesis C-methylase UbiE
VQTANNSEASAICAILRAAFGVEAFSKRNMSLSQQNLKSKWNTVDQASDPASFVRFMDSVRGATDDDPEHYRTIFDLLDIHEGERFLDVGCGTGGAMRALARRAGETVRVFGVDKSATMIEEARKRAGKNPSIEFHVGDAHHLPFADNYFDASYSLRVFEIIEEPRKAVGEMVRVLRPGGRIVINAPDIDLWSIDASDREVTRLILHYMCDHEANGWVGRQMPAFCQDAGLVDIQVVPVTGVIKDFNLIYEFWLGEVVERAQAAGAVSREAVASWLADLHERQRAGRFFCSQTQFRVTGRKPAAQQI